MIKKGAPSRGGTVWVEHSEKGRGRTEVRSFEGQQINTDGVSAKGRGWRSHLPLG
jgi:hypothetical protein